VKLAILADIHANATALDAVLRAASNRQVERILVAGDLVGYYFQPARVLELLAQWETTTIRGNHEDLLSVARMDSQLLDDCVRKYGPGIEIAMTQLDESQLNYLCQLPHPLEFTIDETVFLMCHGSPWDIDQYIYPDAKPELLQKCITGGQHVIVTGHTHYPMVKNLDGTLLINPGSVGQPRNRVPGAHWVLFDTVTRTWECCREEYDLSGVLDQCRELAPGHQYLADVLTRH